jgi:hypothetical protein
MQKLFCYVDETGQDTRGELFIVAVVATGQERDQLRRTCEAIERDSRKGRRKWVKTTYSRRLAYIQKVLEKPIFRGKLNFAVYRDTQDYSSLTVQVIIRALHITSETDYGATILIDGLPRSMEQVVGLQLRRSGIHAKKVRGLKDESDALIRLADAICGLVRGAIEGQPAMRTLLDSNFHDPRSSQSARTILPYHPQHATRTTHHETRNTHHAPRNT